MCYFSFCITGLQHFSTCKLPPILVLAKVLLSLVLYLLLVNTYIFTSAVLLYFRSPFPTFHILLYFCSCISSFCLPPSRIFPILLPRRLLTLALFSQQCFNRPQWPISTPRLAGLTILGWALGCASNKPASNDYLTAKTPHQALHTKYPKQPLSINPLSFKISCTGNINEVVLKGLFLGQLRKSSLLFLLGYPSATCYCTGLLFLDVVGFFFLSVLVHVQ